MSNLLFLFKIVNNFTDSPSVLQFVNCNSRPCSLRNSSIFRFDFLSEILRYKPLLFQTDGKYIILHYSSTRYCRTFSFSVHLSQTFQHVAYTRFCEPAVTGRYHEYAILFSICITIYTTWEVSVRVRILQSEKHYTNNRNIALISRTSKRSLIENRQVENWSARSVKYLQMEQVPLKVRIDKLPTK